MCDANVTQKFILPFASQSMRLWQVPFLKLFFAWQAALSNDIKSKSENSEKKYFPTN
jgi:hypothetical protein